MKNLEFFLFIFSPLLSLPLFGISELRNYVYNMALNIVYLSETYEIFFVRNNSVSLENDKNRLDKYNPYFYF